MNQLKYIFSFIFILSVVFGQHSNLKSTDYDKHYPQYFHAIENGAGGNFENALPVFKKMLNQFPKHQEAFLLITICEDAIYKRISNNAAEYIFKGLNIKHDSDRFDEVISLFGNALKEEKNYLPFYLIRGNYYAKTSKYDQAHSDLSKAIQLAPKSALSYYNRGKLLFDNEFDIQALSDFNKVLELNPNYSSAYIKRAQIFSKMLEYGRSFQDFQTAYKIDSTSIRSLINSSILNNMATVYIERNNLNNALDALNLSIKADTRWNEPFLNRGIVYKLMNKFDLAIVDLNKSIELKPQAGKAYYNRGLIYKEKQEFDKATNDLIKSLQSEDADVHGYFILAEIYTKTKKFNQATRYYKIALEQEPDNIWIYYQMANLYDRRRGFNEAVYYYDEFVKRASNEFFEHKIKAKDRSDRIKRYLKQQKKRN